MSFIFRLQGFGCATWRTFTRFLRKGIHSYENRNICFVLLIEMCTVHMTANVISLCLQLNPEHTVPTLDDNGTIVWDSHAISIYLIGKYADDDSLYPSDVVQRAKCNQRLFFHNGTLLQRFRALVRSIFYGATEIPERSRNRIHEAYGIMETFLETDLFLVGEQITLADVCTAVTTTTLSPLVPITDDQYPNILDWLNRVREEIPFFDQCNVKYSIEYYEILMATMERNRALEKARVTAEPLDEPLDKPSDEPLDEPSDEPLDKPSDEPFDQPLDDQYLEQPQQQPQEQSEKQSQDQQGNQPQDNPENEPKSE